MHHSAMSPVVDTLTGFSLNSLWSVTVTIYVLLLRCPYLLEIDAQEHLMGNISLEATSRPHPDRPVNRNIPESRWHYKVPPVYAFVELILFPCGRDAADHTTDR